MDTRIKILQQKKILESVALQLKSEFVGLDNIIDEVTELIAPWFMFPEAQMRPTVVNLWGMTGTGKTALISRIAELLKFEKRFLRFDMGDDTFGEYDENLKGALREDMAHFNEEPLILVLDEFQFARTINEDGDEVSNQKHIRIIWDLLDSGKFHYTSRPSATILKRCTLAWDLIMQCVELGVKITDGKMTTGKETFDQLFKGFSFSSYGGKEKKKVNYFSSGEFATTLYNLLMDKYPTQYIFRQHLKTLKLPEIADLLVHAVEYEGAAKIMDFSQALIFVIGNLDEAYYMSSNINPDISADEFYQHTLNISISDIKSALRNRFRAEQIARLGNNHIIYPAFSSNGYYKLIDKELNRINIFVKDRFGFVFDFDKSMRQIIYEEGVTPTQGARPVLTTVKQLAESYITRIIADVMSQEIEPESGIWSFVNKQYEIDFLNIRKQSLGKFTYSVRRKLYELRRSTNSQAQAYTALHEAGHVVLAALSLRIIPEYALSRTADSDSAGFCLLHRPKDIYTKDLLIKDIIVSLGGLLAEKIVLGENFVSSGVSSDIKNATKLATMAIRQFGMGKKPVHLAVLENAQEENAFMENERQQQEATNIVEFCEIEARNILQRNKYLLLQIANYLTNHSRIGKETIKEYVIKYSTEKWVQSSGFMKPENYFDVRGIIAKQLKKSEVNS